jgi:hypothetical protein
MELEKVDSAIRTRSRAEKAQNGRGSNQAFTVVMQPTIRAREFVHSSVKILIV